jgi:hypothetical protein
VRRDPVGDLALLAVDFNVEGLLGDAGGWGVGIFGQYGHDGRTSALTFILRKRKGSDREKPCGKKSERSNRLAHVILLPQWLTASPLGLLSGGAGREGEPSAD